jgi:glutaredoxin
MQVQKITVYGTEWCGDCFRTRQFLKRNLIPFSFINIDRDKDAEKYVLNTNRGMRSVPTIVFEDGTILVEPSNQELAAKVGIDV